MISKHHFILAVLLGVAASGRPDILPEKFLADVFSPVPSSQALAPDADARKTAFEILGARYSAPSVLYWRQNGQTVWILEARGKHDLIQAGFVIEQGKIKESRVLRSREDRGRGIETSRFLNQFKGVFLDEKGRLSERVDGFSGATLSANAMRNMARLALFFDSLVSGAPE